MKTLKSCFKEAKRKKYAIGQFNFSTLEQMEAIVMAAKKNNTPIIFGTSRGEANFFGMEKAVILRNYYRKIFPYLYLNLDHARDPVKIKRAINLGYDCVHFDGGNLPIDKNIKEVKKIVKYAHLKGALVEGEIKSIQGKGGSILHKQMHYANSSDYENPDEARSFVEQTGVDSLAVNVGNVHGVFENPIILNIELLQELRKKIPAFLVLHGGSGTRPSDIKKAVKNGIVKININTELRIAWKKAMRKELEKSTIKPYDIYPQVIETVQKKVEEKIKLFK